MEYTHTLTVDETIKAFREVVHARKHIATQSASGFRKSLEYDGKTERFIVEAKFSGSDVELHYVGPSISDAVRAYNQIRRP